MSIDEKSDQMQISDNLVESFLLFFEETIPLLEKTYVWPMPKKPISGFIYDKNNNLYEQRIALKNFLVKEWHNNNFNSKEAIASWIVKDWGGIPGNKAKTLKEYLDRMESNHSYTPIKGIASYSKILAAAYPNDYAIYDARVAASLNAIQLMKSFKDGVAFHYLDGRNNIIGNKNKKIGFTQKDRFSIKNLTSPPHNFLSIDKNNVYNTYITLLKNIVKKNTDIKLYQCEMVLFSQAADLCKTVMSSKI